MSEKIWNNYCVTFKLNSPLHIGYLPFKGSVVSSTRHYVPGKNFWGAITKRITEYLYTQPNGNDYRKIGIAVMQKFKFSYFYLIDGETIFLPQYTEEGLKYGDSSNSISHSQLEYIFIGSRISTAINTEFGTAKDESLHEIEFLKNKFRNENGEIINTNIIGQIWIENNAKIKENRVDVVVNKGIFINKDFNIISELILGGESKYGFGHVLFDSINEDKFSITGINTNNELITIKKESYLPFHLKFDEKVRFMGNIELLTGRGYIDPKDITRNSDNQSKPGSVLSKAQYYFSPGTKILVKITGKLNWDGTVEASVYE